MTSTMHAQPALFPCSPTQTQFLMLDAMEQGRTALNYAFRYRIDGPLRLDVLQQAFDLLLARHEILRTGFVANGGVMMQAVWPAARSPLRLIDCSHLAEGPANQQAEQAGREEAALAFDFTRPPLIRLTLLKFGPERFNLLIAAHATVIDGWSLSILLAELGETIAAIHAGTAPRLPDVEMHFGDYALWQAEMAKSGAFDNDIAYWRTELDGVSTFRLPPARAVPEARTYPSLTRGIGLAKVDTDRIRALAQSRGSTFYQMALASLAAILHRRSGEAEIVIGTQVSGRNEEDAEGITGPLINAVVLRLPVTPDETLGQLVTQAATTSANALTHQSVPFASMVEAVAPTQAMQRNPLYAINFALQAAFIHDDNADFKAYGPFAIHSLPSQSHNAIWELNFGLVERPDGWRMSCEADGELFDAPFIDGILADWSKALAWAADQPVLTVGDLPIAGVPARQVRAIHAGSAVTNTPTPVVHLSSVRPVAVDDRVIVFNRRGSKVPIIALNVNTLFHNLAKSDPSRPFYDIQLAADVAPKTFAPRAIADLAADAVRLIRRARPQGPYVLLAYCVAGSIAIEAARQLLDDGEDVPLVVMVDTWAPGYREDLSAIQRYVRFLQIFKHHIGLEWSHMRRGDMSLRDFFGIGKNLIITGFNKVFARSEQNSKIAQLNAADHPTIWYLDYVHFAYHYHRPEPYPGMVLHMRAVEVCEGRMFPRDFGWDRYLAGSYVVADFPGEHGRAFEMPGVGAIHDKIEETMSPFDAAYGVRMNKDAAG